MNGNPKRSVFEWCTQIIVPVLATIAIFFQLQQRIVALSLVALAVISLLVSVVPQARRMLKQRRLRENEESIAGIAFDDLKSRIHKFGDFVNMQCNDTLQYIIFNGLCGCNGTHYDSLNLLPGQFVAEIYELLRNRTDKKKPSLDALRDSVMEFNSLVGGFCRWIACPVYDRIPSQLPPDLAKAYTQNVQRDLIQFRERFAAFLEGYTDFLKDLDRKLPNPLGLGFYFQRPKPLAAAPTER